VAALGNILQGGIKSLGNLFGMGSGAPMGMGSATPPTSMPPGTVDPLNTPTSSAITNPSAMSSTPSMGSMDPLTQALLAQLTKSQSNPWVAAAQGLGPLGQTLEELKKNWTVGSMAPESHASVQQPGPLQFQGGQAPGSPLATAALIAQLL
jgi:hypothetical protein